MPLQQDGVYDVALQTVRVSGTVTLNGAAPPSSSHSPTLQLRDSDGSSGLLVELGRGASYAARVLPGNYDVVYQADPTATGQDAYPCQSGVIIKEGVSLTGSGVLDLDLQTVKVSGEITLNQRPLPAASSYPELLLRDRSGAAGRLAALEQTRQAEGRYSAHVFAGSFDLLYRYSGPGCGAGPYPCQQDLLLRAGLSLTADGNLDQDLKTVTVTGQVTLNGEPLPPGSSRPTITLRQGSSSGTLIELARGDSYTAQVFPGSYELLYQSHPNAICQGNPFPCLRDIPLKQALQLQSAGVLDLDLKTLTVSGQVTLNGGPFPDGQSSRVTALAAEGQALPQLIDLTQLPGGSFETALFAGRYMFLHSNEDSFCSGAQVPCQRRALLQCGGF